MTVQEALAKLIQRLQKTFRVLEDVDADNVGQLSDLECEAFIGIFAKQTETLVRQLSCYQKGGE